MTIKDFQILNQWFSPNYPTGGFSYSHGFDALIAEGQIQTLEDLKQALLLVLEHGGAHSDAVFLAHSYHEKDVNLIAQAFSSSAERLEETLTQGANFAKAISKSHGLIIAPMPFPNVVGRASRQLDIDLETVLVFYLQAFVTNIAMIAQRLVPFSASDVNKILTELHEPIAKTAKKAMTSELNDIYSSTWLIDFASLAHETQGVRLCKT